MISAFQIWVKPLLLGVFVTRKSPVLNASEMRCDRGRSRKSPGRTEDGFPARRFTNCRSADIGASDELLNTDNPTLDTQQEERRSGPGGRAGESHQGLRVSACRVCSG